MKRRAFLGLVGTTITAFAGTELKGGPEQCYITLVYDREPVTEEAESEFYWDSEMTALFQTDRAFQCNGVTMRREGDQYPFILQKFDLINVTPNVSMEIKWKVHRLPHFTGSPRHQGMFDRKEKT